MSNINPAQIWNNAMKKSFKDPVPKPKPIIKTPKPPVDVTDPERVKARREQAIRTRDKLLAKNPNHFREIRHKKKEVVA